jgi:hypothetical protein
VASSYRRFRPATYRPDNQIECDGGDPGRQRPSIHGNQGSGSNVL